MKVIKKYSGIFLVGLIAVACVERYFPATEANFAPRLVIAASLAADDGDQNVIISESSSPANPKFSPVSGCTVFVEDENGNRIPFAESVNAGHYTGKFEGANVIVDSKYRLSVEMPGGEQYLSKYEELMPCPKIDTVYSEVVRKQTTDPAVTEDGLQFYTDFTGDENYGNYFRWQLTETYEYHSEWPLDKWLDDQGSHDLAVPDYSHFVCYETDSLPEIFLLSTEGYSQNSYPKFKLNFVNDHTQRLLHKYSLMVRQYSLTKSAYNYWKSLRNNNQESIDLFGKQPDNVKGNIYNASDTSEVVLGYFAVSVVSEKRIMVSDVNGLSFAQVPYCKATPIDSPLPPFRPLYFAEADGQDGQKVLGLANEECFFCEMMGGTTVKPPYWDNK